MKVYTVQMAKWRKVKKMKIPFVDTTVKSGRKEFAPTWDMVMGVKDGTLSQEDYSERYLALMKESLVNNPIIWGKLLAKDAVALACYCRAGVFCHRHILTDFIENLCREKEIPFERGGEID